MSTLFSRIADKANLRWPVHRQACVRVKRALITAHPNATVFPETAIADMLADIRHLCDRLKLDFAQLDKQGRGYYIEERKFPTARAKQPHGNNSISP